MYERQSRQSRKLIDAFPPLPSTRTAVPLCYADAGNPLRVEETGQGSEEGGGRRVLCGAVSVVQ